VFFASAFELDEEERVVADLGVHLSSILSFGFSSPRLFAS
jgi:hypothetical protein